MNPMELADRFLAEGRLSKVAHARIAGTVRRGPTKTAAPPAGLIGGAGRFLGSLFEHPVGQHLALGGALATASGMYSVVKGMIDARQIEATFGDMLRIFPDLRQHPQSKVRRIFDVIVQYAPEVAKNATVAGTFVRGVLQFPNAEVTPEHVRSLLGVQGGLLVPPGAIELMAQGMAQGVGRGLVQSAVTDPYKEQELALKRKDVGSKQLQSLFGALGTTGDLANKLEQGRLGRQRFEAEQQNNRAGMRLQGMNYNLSRQRDLRDAGLHPYKVDRERAEAARDWNHPDNTAGAGNRITLR